MKRSLFLTLFLTFVFFGFSSAATAAYRNYPGPKNNNLPVGTFLFKDISVILPIQEGWVKQNGYSVRYKRGGFPNDVACSFVHNKVTSYQTMNFVILASKKAKEGRTLREKEFLQVIKTELKLFFRANHVRKKNPTPVGKVFINNNKNQALYQSVITDLMDGRSFQLTFLGTVYQNRRIIIMIINFSATPNKSEYNHTTNIYIVKKCGGDVCI